MYYTGCSYEGETTGDGRRFGGQGVFTFANGDTYVGAFHDGCMHGHGTLFFTEERGGGQYRGVWENGRNVSGAFVFADGLVFGGRDGAGVSCGDGGAWRYCREGDRRLWAEHLREVMPVLPQQAILGGVRVPQSTLWAEEPVVAPCVAEEAKTPATFAQRQPRSLTDVPAEFWKDPQQRERVVTTVQLPTPPFVGAQGGAGREETMTDTGGKPMINLSLRTIVPLQSEAMKRAIAEAVAASAVRRTPTPRSTAAGVVADEGSLSVACVAGHEGSNAMNASATVDPLRGSVSMTECSRFVLDPFFNPGHSTGAECAMPQRRISSTLPFPDSLCCNFPEEEVFLEEKIVTEISCPKSTVAQEIDLKEACGVEMGECTISIDVAGMETTSLEEAGQETAKDSSSLQAGERIQ